MKTMVISGHSRGIGKFLAEYYNDKGWFVIGLSRSRACDVTDEQNVIAAISGFPTIDACINCAGIAAMNHSLTMPISRAADILNTNVIGTFIVSRQCAKRMLAHNNGRIINFSSIASPMDIEGESIYAASKAAIERLTRIMAKELAPAGITCNCVGPNPIETDLIKGLSKGKIDALINKQPIKRIGTFEDVANVCDFFLDDRSNFITGQTIYIGGIS
jgi:3-oxoacyl-[acyl-carrier protein] reductase